MRTFSIQYASNLFVHQNQSWKHAQRLLTIRKAPNLALLGNIGNPDSEKTKDFVRWCADNWDQVYCVPGPAELRTESRLNGLFKNIPANVMILDHVEKHIGQNLVLVGCPLWTSHGKTMEQYTQWSESMKFFMAYRTPRELKHWHEEDVEFLTDRIRYNNMNDGSPQKIILLTHHVPHRNLIPSYVDSERHIMLHEGNIWHLMTKGVIGCLSGAGGGSITGTFGPAKAFCAVNAAFYGPSMVPNSQYRSDMTASFEIDSHPMEPEPAPVRGYGVRLSDFFPRPQLAAGYANPVLQ